MLLSRKIVLILAIAALLVAVPVAVPLTDVFVLAADAIAAHLVSEPPSAAVQSAALQALPPLRAPPLV